MSEPDKTYSHRSGVQTLMLEIGTNLRSVAILTLICATIILYKFL